MSYALRSGSNQTLVENPFGDFGPWRASVQVDRNIEFVAFLTCDRSRTLPDVQGFTVYWYINAFVDWIHIRFPEMEVLPPGRLWDEASADIDPRVWSGAREIQEH
ncbi:hypothetical protein NPIL_118021 [Nephila pilipes]|uniref:Uncharacterized protein n=1 Tax=Nephila pilipes TaxID=299642 RepID=A0A8X6T3J2_NEPPI|nr:hypothetical protein NPIL_118021 [Nephila pilipes]